MVSSGFMNAGNSKSVNSLRVTDAATNEVAIFNFESTDRLLQFLKCDLDFYETDECSATVEVTVGAATASFTMTGPCEGFAERMAARTAQMREALEKASLSLWERLENWWNNL